MYAACTQVFPNADAAILCAAVSDFKPMCFSDTKIKREKDNLHIELQPTHDIAATLGQQKNTPATYCGIRFGNQHEEANALAKLERRTPTLLC